MVSHNFGNPHEYFSQQKLDEPYIPKAMKDKVEPIQEGLFSSRKVEELPRLYQSDEPCNPYDLPEYLGEALSSKVDDYVLFGYLGHGVHSKAMHYYYVGKNVAIFYQITFGSPYNDPNEERERVNELISKAKPIVKKIKAAAEKDLIKEDERLIIIQSDMNGNGWGWVKGHTDIIDEETWKADGDVEEALADIPVPKISD